MASEVDICNTALSNIGDPSVVVAINPPDGSIQAAHCARWYPMARDSVLEMHSWAVNTRRANLTPFAITPPIGWAFAYALPVDCLKPLAVLLPESLPSWWMQSVNDPFGIITPDGTDTTNAQDYTVETLSDGTGSRVLYTNIENAGLVYSVLITDTTKFGPLLVQAIARFLASLLAGPILKGEEGRNESKAQLKLFMEIFKPWATQSDANARQTSPYRTATPAPIAARA